MSPGPRRVLLVEDHSGYARLVELTVTSSVGADVELVRAATWEQARGHLADGGLSCVLLDLALPDEAGSHLVDLVLRAAPGVPVIVLTGREGPGLEDDLRARGAVAFVAKDDTQSALVPALRAVLRAGGGPTDD